MQSVAQLDLSDVSLYYEDHGVGEPILFLHGLGGATRDWELQRRCFESSYRVLVHDVCGHGQSSKPPGPYSLAQFGRQSADLIRRVVGGPVHVVGLSMGGMIAFQLAVDAPDLIRTLTIVNSGP
jgi:3-oxoadipate enol-lactonase